MQTQKLSLPHLFTNPGQAERFLNGFTPHPHEGQVSFADSEGQPHRLSQSSSQSLIYQMACANASLHQLWKERGYSHDKIQVGYWQLEKFQPDSGIAPDIASLLMQSASGVSNGGIDLLPGDALNIGGYAVWVNNQDGRRIEWLNLLGNRNYRDIHGVVVNVTGKERGGVRISQTVSATNELGVRVHGYKIFYEAAGKLYLQNYFCREKKTLTHFLLAVASWIEKSGHYPHDNKPQSNLSRLGRKPNRKTKTRDTDNNKSERKWEVRELDCLRSTVFWGKRIVDWSDFMGRWDLDIPFIEINDYPRKERFDITLLERGGFTTVQELEYSFWNCELYRFDFDPDEFSRNRRLNLPGIF